jgi:hypothetical protein
VNGRRVIVPVPATLSGDASRALAGTVSRRRRGETVVLDCGRLQAADDLPAAQLLTVVAEGRTHEVDVRLANLTASMRRALAGLDPAILDAAPAPAARHPLEAIGMGAIAAADALAALGSLVGQLATQITRPIGRRGIKWGRAVEQMALVGSAAVPIVLSISLLIGVVLALNSAQQLRQVGATADNANKVLTDFYARRTRLYGGVETALRNLDATARDARTLTRKTEAEVSRTADSADALIADLSATASRLRETLDVIRSDPSVLLRGRTVPEREHAR